MGRRLVREKALQALYEVGINRESDRVLQRAEEELEESVGKEDRAFFHRLTRGVLEKTGTIDPVIHRFLREDWPLSRLPRVDLTILRMAVYELLFEPDIPSGATLNEAVELAKTFSTEESGRFINGVLGSVVKNLEEIRSAVAPVDGE